MENEEVAIHCFYSVNAANESEARQQPQEDEV